MTIARVFAVAAVIILLVTAYLGYELNRLGASLRTDTAPRGILSLTLAPTALEARAILREWSLPSALEGCPSLACDAQRVIDLDNLFLWAYLALGISLVLYSGLSAGVPGWVMVTVGALWPATALFDWIENRQVVLLLATDLNSDFSQILNLARTSALSKLTLSLLAAAPTLALVIGSQPSRLKKGTPAPAPASAQNFDDLLKLENRDIFIQGRPADGPQAKDHRAADESYVVFREADVIGLALSGGGIRSATFNLGLLQGMHRLRLLRLFDYLATVSGGGYIGSFWSEWLARQPSSAESGIKEDDIFPIRSDGSNLDTEQERHLREFSGFLAPRLGFFNVETWTAVVAVLSGLLPALLIGLSVIGILLIAWLTLTFSVASANPMAAVAVLLILVTVVLAAFERMWQQLRSESAGNETGWYWLSAGVAVALVGSVQAWLPAFYGWWHGAWPIFYPVSAPAGAWQQATGDHVVARWWTVSGVANSHEGWLVSPRLFDFGLACVAAAILLVMLRMCAAVRRAPCRERVAAFDRVLMRVLGFGLAWLVIAGLWHLSINLANVAVRAAGAAALSAAAFAALRNWIGLSLRRPAEAKLTDRLKPYLPQVLAYLTIALSAVALGAFLIWFCGTDWWRWQNVTAAMLTFLVLALFIHTDEFGLHAFYRDRISRAYAGACNLAGGMGAAGNRATEPKKGDDRQINKLARRPLHLVCCAANDLSGDQVETLSRGARSAVLSRHGFSLGGHFRGWPSEGGLMLGSAITASAAAFNSNMGQVSMRLGPAVSFLMTMLNLRLGLWLRHPAASVNPARPWPGLLLYREMFGLTASSGRLTASKEPSPYMSDVHLSDGGHFENLSLYELIRRHCRYILVSDCGADPTVAFDDLGNALRRVREDFGIDITLDVSPLRPGKDGLSRQHLAVGTIHYSENDRGILLYVKPSITGDEAPDVLQYRHRNAEFPHESTGDQFYDEAQWESYRRLGLHAADCIFEFVTREDAAGNRPTADWVFAEAARQWGPTPDDLEARVLEMTKRFSDLDCECQQRIAGGLLTEVFPELALPAIKKVYEQPSHHAPPAAESSAANLSYLLRVVQLMEDAWLYCQLDRWWSHPLNLGWINLFARWATSGEFRFWWPLLSPMFSPGFRRFIQTRFPLPDGPKLRQGKVSTFVKGQQAEGLAEVWLNQRATQRFNWNDARGIECSRKFYEHTTYLPRLPEPVPMQTGLLGVTRHDKSMSIGWTSDDFFVPPSLWGADIGGNFLMAVLLEEFTAGTTSCFVVVRRPADGARHQVARDDYRSFLEQYRKIGFRETGPAASQLNAVLCAELGFSKQDGDTLLDLDLKHWKAWQDASARRDGKAPDAAASADQPV